MVAVLFAISVIVFLIFNVIPAIQSGAADRGQERDPALITSVEEEWGSTSRCPCSTGRR